MERSGRSGQLARASARQQQAKSEEALARGGSSGQHPTLPGAPGPPPAMELAMESASESDEQRRATAVLALVSIAPRATSRSADARLSMFRGEASLIPSDVLLLLEVAFQEWGALRHERPDVRLPQGYTADILSSYPAFVNHVLGLGGEAATTLTGFCGSFHTVPKSGLTRFSGVVEHFLLTGCFKKPRVCAFVSASAAWRAGQRPSPLGSSSLGQHPFS